MFRKYLFYNFELNQVVTTNFISNTIATLMFVFEREQFLQIKNRVVFQHHRGKSSLKLFILILHILISVPNAFFALV